jgi:hypothetical protein
MGEKSVGEKLLGENRVRWDAGFRFPLLRYSLKKTIKDNHRYPRF